MKNKKEIQFSITDKSIQINISIDLLKWIAEKNPDTPLKVKNKNEFAEKVLEVLKDDLGEDGSGLTGFQILIDEACLMVAENAEECVDFKEEQD